MYSQSIGLHSCIVLITVPSPGGIGAETALSLAAASPSTLILVGRSAAKGQPTVDKIKQANPLVKVKFVEAELSSMESIRKAAQEILDDTSIPAIHTIINNAGIMVPPYAETEDGFESQFATNHLSHFLLVNKLMPKLLAAGNARVVNVSSVGNKYSGMNWDDIHFKKSYTPQRGYSQSKTAQILFAVSLNKKLASRGVRAFALDPGSVQTGLAKYISLEIAKDMAQKIAGVSLEEARAARGKTVPQGCATTLVAALDPTLGDGVYLADCEITIDPARINPWALDEDNADRCWNMSEECVGEKFVY
jgi:NAD(P)-dependent dehydrogenase (short-subunit alcohol dehydrogenase family)